MPFVWGCSRGRGLRYRSNYEISLAIIRNISLFFSQNLVQACFRSTVFFTAPSCSHWRTMTECRRRCTHRYEWKRSVAAASEWILQSYFWSSHLLNVLYTLHLSFESKSSARMTQKKFKRKVNCFYFFSRISALASPVRWLMTLLRGLVLTNFSQQLTVARGFVVCYSWRNEWRTCRTRNFP